MSKKKGNKKGVKVNKKGAEVNKKGADKTKEVDLTEIETDEYEDKIAVKNEVEETESEKDNEENKRDNEENEGYLDIKIVLATRLALMALVTMFVIVGIDIAFMVHGDKSKSVDVDAGNIENSSTEDELNNDIDILNQNPKQIISNDISKLIDGNSETIHRYFGDSDVYTTEKINDRVSIAKVNFIYVDMNGESIYDDIDNLSGLDNGDVTAMVHICTLDYNKTKHRIDEIEISVDSEHPDIDTELRNRTVTQEIANNAADGLLDVHVNIPIVVHYENGVGKVVVTEALKTAITGYWYNATGEVLMDVECPLIEG